MYVETQEEQLYRIENNNSYILQKNIRHLNKIEKDDLQKKIKLSKEGDETAKLDVFNSYIRLVVYEAKKFVEVRKVYILEDDIIQEGLMELWDYIDKYDNQKGYSFTTCFMFRLKKVFHAYYGKYKNKLTISENGIYEIKKAKEIDVNSKNREDAVKIYNQEVGSITNKRFNDLISASNPMVNIDKPVNDEENNVTIGSIIPSDENIEKEYIEKETKEELSNILSSLSPVEQKVLRIVYGSKSENEANKNMNELSKETEMNIFKLTAIRLSVESKIKNNKIILELLGGD